MKPTNRPTSARRFLGVCLALTMAACSRMPPAPPEPVFVPVSPPQAIVDDLPLDTLLDALAAQIAVLERRPEGVLRFGKKLIPANVYRAALIDLFTYLHERHSTAEIAEHVRQTFEFVAIETGSGSGLVQVTAYFEPIIAGSHAPTPTHSHPLYRKPNDLQAFRDRSGQIQHRRVGTGGGYVPGYFSRREIDIGGALHGQGLEICYVDPLDAFILQTQGSGTIKFEDGSFLRLNFADKNGLPYVGLGKLSEGKIAGHPHSLAELEAGLRKLPRNRLLAILAGNPSYIFFRPGDDHAVTAVGSPAIAGRTVATDRSIYPKGALAFLTFGRPVFADSTSPLPTSFRSTTRFVVDQDVGSAILGPKRLDLFIGQGDGARREAGAINGSGRLLYLVPKP